jgi:hypothetical protein
MIRLGIIRASAANPCSRVTVSNVCLSLRFQFFTTSSVHHLVGSRVISERIAIAQSGAVDTTVKMTDSQPKITLHW